MTTQTDELGRFKSFFQLQRFATDIGCALETYDDLLRFSVEGDEAGCREVAVLFKRLHGCFGEPGFYEVASIYARSDTGDWWWRLPIAVVPLSTLTALADDYEAVCAERAEDAAIERGVDALIEGRA